MKTMNFLVIFLLFLVSGSAMGQHQTIPVYPIPSMNVAVEGLAAFENTVTVVQNNLREKRQVHIHFIAVPPIPPDCEATVWVYSLDGTTVLGPFIVSCGETLDVDIDGRDWGVMVDSDFKIIVNVWITIV